MTIRNTVFQVCVISKVVREDEYYPGTPSSIHIEAILNNGGAFRGTKIRKYQFKSYLLIRNADVLQRWLELVTMGYYY